MVFIVSSALMLGRTVSAPLLELKDAAVAMEGSTLTREQAAELQDSEGTDEIADEENLRNDGHSSPGT